MCVLQSVAANQRLIRNAAAAVSHYSTLQRNAAHCNILQHSATHTQGCAGKGDARDARDW